MSPAELSGPRCFSPPPLCSCSVCERWEPPCSGAPAPWPLNVLDQASGAGGGALRYSVYFAHMSQPVPPFLVVMTELTRLRPTCDKIFTEEFLFSAAGDVRSS